VWHRVRAPSIWPQRRLTSTGLGAEDVLLTNSANGLSYTAASFVYDATADQVTLQYASLPEGAYTLTLLSGASSVRDLVGNALNGDTSDPDADNYVLHFNVDDAAGALPAWRPRTRRQPDLPRRGHRARRACRRGRRQLHGEPGCGPDTDLWAAQTPARRVWRSNCSTPGRAAPRWA